MLEGGQLVNKLGKFLYRHIDGAYKIEFSVNTCDVYMFMYYQTSGEEMQEMRFDLSITTYQNKIRVNITEVTAMERTIGQIIYKPEQLQDADAAVKRMYMDVVKKIEKAYQDYEFVF